MSQPDDKLTAFKYWLSIWFKWLDKEALTNTNKKNLDYTVSIKEVTDFIFKV